MTREGPAPRKNRKSVLRKRSGESLTLAESKLLNRLKQAKREFTTVSRKLNDLKTVHKVLDGEKNTGVVTAVPDEILDKRYKVAQQKIEKNELVIFAPNKGPQTDFLAANEREVFYGGARGGGKSYAMLVDPLRYYANRHHRAVIIRRTMPELRDLIVKSHFLYPKAVPNAKWKEQDKVWTFPSGARIEFGFVENMQDAMRYQGQSYSWIGVDELPQFPTPDIWNFLRSSNRSVDPDLPVFMRATGNPGNIGSLWVKEMFIDPAPPNTRFTQDVEFYDNSGNKFKAAITKRFIPAKVWDNPYLTYDHTYVATLASLNEAQRKQFLEGNWDVIEGAAFPDFNRDIHVVTPYEIPNSWTRFRACDFGYASATAVLWFAVDHNHDLHVYRELYCNRKNAEEVAKLILDLERKEKIQYGVLDASVWAQRGDVGPSIAETMIKAGCMWRASDRSPKSRKNGKLEIHRRLAVDEATGQPRIKIFNTCVNLIRTLPVLPTDENDPEDVDTRAEDHAYDALRYGCMSRPLNANYTMGVWRVNTHHNTYSNVIDQNFGY